MSLTASVRPENIQVHSKHQITQKSPRVGEKIVMGLLAGAAGLSVLITIGIVVALLIPSIDFFKQVSIVDFLTDDRWTPNFVDQESYGIWPLLSATLWTTAIALCIALPFGLGSAIFLSEYAKPKARKILKPILEVLAGIPSVVYGFFAVAFVAPVLLKDILHLNVGSFSVLSAGLVLGVMIIPTVASLSEDALSAVPQTLRDGSLALGASKMRTTLRVVLPAALSGVAAAIVLAISRAVGETMIVALAAGGTANLVTSAKMEGQTMTGYMAATATGENEVGSLSYNTLFAVGLTLFVVTFLINLVSIKLVRKFRERY